MKLVTRLISISIIAVFLFYFPGEVKAIIFMPALILIPIAKIVSIIIGAFALPMIGFGAIWSRFRKIPIKKMMLAVFVLLTIIGIMVAVGIKAIDPIRPWF
jgi:hypothetical protein